MTAMKIRKFDVFPYSKKEKIYFNLVVKVLIGLQCLDQKHLVLQFLLIILSSRAVKLIKL